MHIEIAQITVKIKTELQNISTYDQRLHDATNK